MKVLFTPLNWGLGHATRSAALADRYRKEGHEIVWGAYGEALEWIQMNCPQDQIHNLEMKLKGVKPMDSHIDCVGCGS